MTKQELDDKLTENGLEPKQTYAVENPSWGDVYLIKKLNSSEGYRIYYNERGKNYLLIETKTIEEAYDFIWNDIREINSRFT